MRVIFGMTGEKGAGKDTFAQYFIERGFKRIAFGDLLYQEVADAFGVTVADLARRDLKEAPQARFALQHCRDPQFIARIRSLFDTAPNAPLSPRFLLQHWGTEYRRQMVSDLYWVRPVEQAILAAPYDHFVITDIREDTEIAMTQRVGGQIYTVVMEGKLKERAAGGDPTDSSQHSSERIARIAASAPWCNKVFKNVWGKPEILMQQAETLHESYFQKNQKFAKMA